MTEEFPKGPEEAKEKNWEDMTQEEQAIFEAEMLEDVKERHPETPPEKRWESEPDIKEFRRLVSYFKEIYSLEALHAITDLDPLNPEDVAKYPIREEAKRQLIVIVRVLNMIKEKTDITPEKIEELKQEYYVISRAVGIINNKKVDHTRML